VTGNGLIADHINAFPESNLRSQLLKNLVRSKYTTPTPVQKYAMPIILSGRDIMCCAQTGSGKTAAFLLPVLHKLLESPDLDPSAAAAADLPAPEALIIVPTRELCDQIFNETRKLSDGTRLRTVKVYGQMSMHGQRDRLRAGVNVLVATPGRLRQFVRDGDMTLSNLKFLILDEADRMLDQGFMPEIEDVVKHTSMPSKERRQTLMFSATFPKAIQEIALSFLNDHLFITVGVLGAANKDVVQKVVKVTKFSKREILEDILTNLIQQKQKKILIFVGTKKHTDYLGSLLNQQNFDATTIHGDRMQRERAEALADFKRGKRPILVATEVVARGIDIPEVNHVINYDLPKEIDTYVHRIGRTGRIGRKGTATSFYDPEEDYRLAKGLVDNLVEAGQPVEDWLAAEAKKMANGFGGGGGGNFQGFGGYASRDVRRNVQNGHQNHAEFTAPPPAEEEELWD